MNTCTVKLVFFGIPLLLRLRSTRHVGLYHATEYATKSPKH